jgi:predicted Zn finger-like uncharacterized protein
VIVTCEQCATQFQLDDSKVPEGGIRVRCSRCKFAFFVESPHGPDADRAEDLARDALERDPTAAAEEREPDDFGLEDESDWQFNEDSHAKRSSDRDADDLAAAQEAVDDLLGSTFSEPGDSESSDLVTGLDAGSDLGASDLEIDSVDSPIASASGSDLDPLPELDEDPNDLTVHSGVHRVHSGAAAEDPADSAPPDLSLDTSPGSDLESSPQLDAAEDFVDPLADLGSPEEWDLVDAEARAPSSGAEPIGRISRPVLTDVEHASDSAEPDRLEADGFAFDADPENSAVAVWMARARSALGWALVCLLVAYAGVVGLWPRLVVSPPVFTTQSVAGLEADAIQGRWIENAIAGPIYVVSGALRGGSAAQPSTGSLLRIRLLDAVGAPIAAESAVVGPPLPAAQVRESNLRDLREAQEAGALRMAWKPLGPGERRPFLAILGRVPPSAVAFEFQMDSAASPAPEPEAGGDIPYPFDGLAAEGMVE